VIYFFSLAASDCLFVFDFFFSFDILIIMCLGIVLFGMNLFRGLLTFLYLNIYVFLQKSFLLIFL
jgi:hypothetical protein